MVYIFGIICKKLFGLSKSMGDFVLKMDRRSFFCVFCTTGRETQAETFLKSLGYTVISSNAERTVYKNNAWVKEVRPLISGYVFFSHTGEPAWREITGFKHIYRSLHYTDNTKQLRNNDLQFVHRLMQNNGIMRISKVIKAGNKIKVIEGPLKQYERNIVKINKRQKCAAIQIAGEGILNTVWLSYEYADVKDEE